MAINFLSETTSILPYIGQDIESKAAATPPLSHWPKTYLMISGKGLQHVIKAKNTEGAGCNAMSLHFNRC